MKEYSDKKAEFLPIIQQDKVALDKAKQVAKLKVREMKAEIVARLAVDQPQLLDVNPHVAEVYRRKVERLTDALADPQTNQEAAMALRSLIGDIVLTPGAKRAEVHATLRGELMSILEFAAARNTPGTSVPRPLTNAVARPRNHYCSNWPPQRPQAPLLGIFLLRFQWLAVRLRRAAAR